MEIAGRVFTDDEALRAAIDAQLRGAPGWALRTDADAFDGLRRAFDDASPAQASVFADAVLAALEAPDVRIRTKAARALRLVAPAVDPDALKALLQHRSHLYVDVEPVGEKLDEPLDEVLLTVLGRIAPPGDAGAANLLRAGLGRGRIVHQGLARVDPDWVVAHAGDLGRDGLGAVLTGLPTAGYRERFVRALSPWPAHEIQPTLNDFLWNILDLDDTEKQHLKDIIAGRA